MTSTDRGLSIEAPPADHPRSSPNGAANRNLDNPNNDQALWGRLYRHRGILYIITASFFNSLHFILAKFVGDDMHVTQLTFLRFCLQFILPLPILVYKGVPVKLESWKVLALLIARGVFGILGVVSLLFSFHFTRVGDATAVVFASPALVGIGARVFMKEAFGIIDALLVGVVIVGIFLISQPPFLFGGDEGGTGLSSQVIGVLLAFMTCFCDSAVTLLLRKLGQLNVNPFKVVFWYALIGIIGAALMTTVFSAWSSVPCYTVRYLVVALSTAAFLCQILLTASLSLENSVFIAVLRTNEVVFSYILEYLVFGLSPNAWVLVGVLVVLLASIAASLKKMWISRRKGIARRRSMVANL